MAEAAEQDRRYRYGDFVVNERRGALQRNGEDVPLRPKSWGVLRHLVLHRGELVTKRALLDAVWRGRVVSEGVVAKSVREIRQALGDEKRAVVRTVPGRGYLFDAPVRVETTADEDRDEPGQSPAALETDLAADSSLATPVVSSLPPVPSASRAGRFAAHRWRHGVLGVLLIVAIAVAWGVALRAVDSQPRGADASQPAPLMRSLAVLPFEDLSTDGEQRFLADRMAEEILNLLATSDELTVIARSLSFAFRDEPADVTTIGRRLNVAYVLEGSLRRSDDTLRVAVQLVDARDGVEVWSASYDRPLGDTLGLQSEIASEVSDQLHVYLANLGEQRPVDPVAYQRYLEARFLFNRRFAGDLARAEQLYLEATRIDPQFGRAWAGLAGVYWVRTDLHLDESIRLSIPEAVEAMALPIARALQADPDLAEAHIRARIYYEMKGDVPRARDHAARALALAPDDPLVLAYTGRGIEESMPPEAQGPLFRKTIAVNPLSLTPRYNFVDWLIRQRRLQEARSEIEAALLLFPGASEQFVYASALIDLFEGDFEAAAAAAKTLPAEADQLHYRTALLVMAWEAQGLTDLAVEARSNLESASDEWAALRVAEIHAFTGAEDESFAWLRKVSRRVAGDLTYRQRFWDHVDTSPFLVELKDDPRWRRLWEEFEMLTANQRQAG